MPCCCVKTLNLCNVPVCGTLEIKQAATGAGSGEVNVYTLVLDYLDTAVTLTQQQNEGENIKFDVDSLNENFQYTGEIFDADGNPVNIGEYDCIKFKTVIQQAAKTGIPPVLNIDGTVVIEAVVDEEPVITGTTDLAFGIVDDSNTVACAAFAGVRVIVIRGNIPIPGIDPLDGSNYFTKLLANDFITFSTPLVSGEFIRIQTIPA